MTRTPAFTFAPMHYEGRAIRGARAVCKCGVSTTLPCNSFRSIGSDDDGRQERFLRRKFERAGWRFDPVVRCPGCAAAADSRRLILHPAANIKETTVVALKPAAVAASPAATPPRVMARDDRRIIFDKLNEHYVDERKGYRDGWNDARVAADLNCPRAWVAQVRDEMFGPEGVDAETRSKIEAAKTLLDEIAKRATEIDARVASLNRSLAAEQQALGDLLARAETIRTTVLNIERMVRG